VLNSRRRQGQLRLQCPDRSYGDLVEMGVVDPNQVARTALQNALRGRPAPHDRSYGGRAVKKKRVPPPAATAWRMGACGDGYVKVRPDSGELSQSVKRRSGPRKKQRLAETAGFFA